MIKGTVERKQRASQVSYTITDTFGGEGDGINILLCGLSGTGRSLLASTFPDPLIINGDHGLDTMKIKNRHIKQVRLHKGGETSKEVMAILQDIYDRKNGFEKWIPKTLIIDTFTAISDFMEEECRIYDPNSEKGTSRGDGLYVADYGSILTRGKRIIDYAKGIVPYVIFIVDIKLNEDPILKGLVESPSVTGKVLPIYVSHAFPEIYYCGVNTEGGKEEWYITSKKNNRFKYGKSKYGVKTITDPTFAKLKEYYEKGKLINTK